MDPDFDTCPICKHAKITLAHDWKCDEIFKLRDLINMISGNIDSCGYSHSSSLHDSMNIGLLIDLVLAGREPHEALKEIE